MAKKKTRSTKPGRAKPTARAMAAPAAVAPTIPTITVPAGGTLMVIVDVGPMTVPFTVSYNGRTVFKGLVDAAEAVPLVPGRQVLGWAFVHATPGWHHTIAYSVDDEDPVVLESKSATENDEGQTVGFAFVQAS